MELNYVGLWVLLGIFLLAELLKLVKRLGYLPWMNQQRLPHLSEEQIIAGRQSFISYLVLRAVAIALIVALAVSPGLRQGQLLVPMIVAIVVFFLAFQWVGRSVKPFVRDAVAAMRGQDAAPPPPEDQPAP